jgi:drug/metabolite transporter (DMT)-like permease
VIGFVWFYEGVQRIGATRAGLFINFVPISAVVLAFFMLREPITWSLAVGAILVLSGDRTTAGKRPSFASNSVPRSGSNEYQSVPFMSMKNL